jgi:hypothetical protein
MRLALVCLEGFALSPHPLPPLSTSPQTIIDRADPGAFFCIRELVLCDLRVLASLLSFLLLLLFISWLLNFLLFQRGHVESP